MLNLDTHICVLWSGCYSLKYVDAIGSVYSWKIGSEEFQLLLNLQPTEVDLR